MVKKREVKFCTGQHGPPYLRSLANVGTGDAESNALIFKKIFMVEK
jgi:hypothetical protein